MADDTEEDFTFPATISNPPPCLLESPPLWPPVSRSGYEDEWSFNLFSLQEFKRRNNITLRENFCYVDHDEHKEEKMDTLWEDLNEKFSEKKIGEGSDNPSSPGGDDHVHVCCVKTLKLSSKTNGEPISWRKPSILVLIRFLFKKSFAMHDSTSGSIKKIEW